MEDKNNDHKDTDINAIMVQFSNIRMRYTEDRKRLLETQGILVTLQEQLRLSRDAEARERHTANEFQRIMKQQQEIIGNFVGVSEENVALEKEHKRLGEVNQELVDKGKAENESWQRQVESLQLTHKRELDELKSFSERKARDMLGDLDIYRAEYDMKRKDMETKFQALQKEKRAEMDITTQICEDKINNMNEQMATMMYDQDQQSKDIAAYKQKIVELERKLMQAEIEARRRAANCPPPTSTPQGYRYNNNSVLPATIMKKTGFVEDRPRVPTPTWRGQGGGKGRSNIQPLEFVADEAASGKKVTFGVPKKRKLFNPNEDDDM